MQWRKTQKGRRDCTRVRVLGLPSQSATNLVAEATEVNCLPGVGRGDVTSGDVGKEPANPSVILNSDGYAGHVWAWAGSTPARFV